MASPTGGRFIFGPPAGFSSTTLGINNGTSVFPAPVAGSFNIEVFTAAGVTTLPALDSGFQAGIIDPNGTLVAPGVLTGTTLRLFTGDYAVTDSVTGNAAQGAATIILGSGNQRIVGAPGDTVQGGWAPRSSMPSNSSPEGRRQSSAAAAPPRSSAGPAIRWLPVPATHISMVPPGRWRF